ncbi:methylase [Aphanothece hegewaldii CCALA 016]|uniref:Methylase n=1 Tax=Aphanothece hegewaldii CCALA 016 TaxID=2107694 RepID=A0A2T1LQW9_9CHRO|nr:strawberry notch family protein [Aphanothece hegewaldii]PSF30079.1 methylase [Aphanothece hegewaldii CCALA 016]
MLIQLQKLQPITPQHLCTHAKTLWGEQWQWKDAYDELETNIITYLLQQDTITLETLIQLQSILPNQTYRSLEQVQLQQFSTPVIIAYLMAQAAQLQPSDYLLEPSAGTGFLALWGQRIGTELILNEVAPRRVECLKRNFKSAKLFSLNAEQINDYLPINLKPTAILMNPPFSSIYKTQRKDSRIFHKHLRSALLRLQKGGRLVILSPGILDYTLYKEIASCIMSVGISGKLYQTHGTNIDTRIHIFDKQLNLEGQHHPTTNNLETLTQLISDLPKRKLIEDKPEPIWLNLPLIALIPKTLPHEGAKKEWQRPVTVKYTTQEPKPNQITGKLYESYQCQVLQFSSFYPHPSPLTESAAMAAIAPPVPEYQPQLPSRILEEKLLSASQLETVIYAGQAHNQYLKDYYIYNRETENLERANSGTRYRQGYMIGDGTGAGKTRQICAIIIDNWIKGRKRALWITKSDKLIHDLQKEWTLLGGNPEQIISLSKFKLGDPIAWTEGIIFTTYNTLITPAKEGKPSRIEQLVEWLKEDFAGIIAFDESHCLANALPGVGERGDKKASLSGSAGLRLQRQLPCSRILYASATNATTATNLGYAERLGLWNHSPFPFSSHQDFVAQIEAAGIAGMEVVSRDLKRLGLYCARNLSFDGVEYECLEHELTPEQVEIYNTYAQCFSQILQNLELSLEATNIKLGGKNLNKQANATAKSTFYSNQQRFFNYLLTALKMPSLLKSISKDLEQELAVIIQIVSTNEALLERRLTQIPTEQWSHLDIDLTPRELILDYLENSFPTQLYEIYTNENGELCSRLSIDHQIIHSNEALALQQKLIRDLALMPPIPTALDQLIWHFGHEQVAEITGRKIRVIEERGVRKIQTRPGSANLKEAQDFMEGKKQILVFSYAGGTGRSYHSSPDVSNQRRRKHYVLESGWTADSALQGLGRSHRSNQVVPPLFCLVTTNVKGEKRFLSTICRRLATLGALTKGQRETGSNQLYREEDNLDSLYAKAALKELYQKIYSSEFPEFGLAEFEKSTGLTLSYQGKLKEDLPPLHQFLNRVLALPINRQNQVFSLFEFLIDERIKIAKLNGTFQVGIETLHSLNFKILSRHCIYSHSSGAKTECVEIERSDPYPIKQWMEVQRYLDKGIPLYHTLENKVAIAIPTTSTITSSGATESRYRLLYPTLCYGQETLGEIKAPWETISVEKLKQHWEEEIQIAPKIKTQTFYLITGLLLPIWDKLKIAENLKVYRLTTDTEEVLLGRIIKSELIQSVYNNFNLGQIKLSNSSLYELILQSSTPIEVGKYKLQFHKVAHRHRIEILEIYDEATVRILSRWGAESEIINWKLRVFLPHNHSKALEIIAKLQENSESADI